MKKNLADSTESLLLLLALIINILLSALAVYFFNMPPALVLQAKILLLVFIFLLLYISASFFVVKKPMLVNFLHYNVLIAYELLFLLRYRFNECILVLLGICYDAYFLFGFTSYLKSPLVIVCLILLLKIIAKNSGADAKTIVNIKNTVKKTIKLNHQYIIDKLILDSKLPRKRLNENDILPGRHYNITIIRKGGLGDILMTLPAVRALKEKYPQNTINYVVHRNQYEALVPAGFIDNIVIVQNIVEYYRTIRKSDLIIDLENTIENETEMPAVDLFCSLLNVHPGSKTINFVIPESYIKWADKFLKKHNIPEGRPIVGIQGGAGSPSRAWDLKSTKTLARLLQERDYYTILFGHDKKYAASDSKITSTIAKTSILQAAALFSKCSIFVCPDSGLLHLAAFINVPVIALFGVIHPGLRTKYYPLCKPIFNNISCSPCNDHSQPPICSNKTQFECMKSITPEQVFCELEKHLK